MDKEFNNLKIKENIAYLEIDLRIFPLNIIYSTSYVFLDKVYIQLLSNKNNFISIRLKLKKNSTETIKEMSDNFFNELIVFADYNNNMKESRKLREIILQKVLLTNDPESFIQEDNQILDKEFEEFLEELDKEEKKIGIKTNNNL